MNTCGGKILSPVSLFDGDAKVSTLIDQQRHCWKEHLVDTIFTAEEASVIKSIPLSWSQRDDVVIWQGTPDGDLTVRSAYKIAMIHRAASQEGPSSMHYPVNWKKIWKLKVPAKIKTFVWRLAWNALPTKMNLVRRNVCTPKECPLCDADMEDREHLFKQCPASQAVWFASPLSLRINPAQSFDVWLKKLLDHEDMDTVAIAAICLWCIWKGRNGRVFEDTVFNPIEIVSMGAAMLQDYKDADDSAVRKRQHETSMPKWSPPPQNWLMMNLDAACFDGMKTGLGAIVSDDQGTIVYSACKLLMHGSSPLVAEALALRWGLHMIVSQGVQRIRINTDSQVLSKCFKGTSTIPSEILHLVLDCIYLLSSLSEFSLYYVSRRVNVPTHLLASYAIECPDNVWQQSAPRNVFEATLADLLNQ